MNNFLPDMYVKNVFDIDYKKLKKSKIKCLIFSLDNTIAAINESVPSKRIKELIEYLKESGFKVIIVSNNSKKRVEPFKEQLNVDSAFLSRKPSSKKYVKILELYNFKAYNIAVIGNNLYADIYGANRMEFTSILVNSLSTKEAKCNKIYNIINKFVYHKLSKKGLLRKGEYYE